MSFGVNRKSNCPDCNKEFNWKDTVPNIGEVKGYISRTYTCECGKELSNFQPHTEEKIKLWESIKPGSTDNE